jgi:hypothetical protein
MYAKSIIEHVRGRLLTGAWTQQLSFVPVVMALAVAVLPFTLESRIQHTRHRCVGGRGACRQSGQNSRTGRLAG